MHNCFLLILERLKRLNLHNRKIKGSSLKKDTLLLMLIVLSSSYPCKCNYICFKTLAEEVLLLLDAFWRFFN